VAALVATAPLGLGAQSLWDAWPTSRFVRTPAPCFRHAELQCQIEQLRAKHGSRLGVETVGQSVEGRAIRLVTVGTGRRRVLLWSQMHGDEPSATPALLDVADSLLSGTAGGGENDILDAITLLLVPMLNPDGAERYERRNAQGLDVNRDALNLASPEGRMLKAVRDRFEPELGFNLHDQNRRTTVGGSSGLATISLLAVAGDASDTMTPGRARAKRACAAVVSALLPLIPDGVARYDEDWNPRAFGDNITAWGTPVVLLESGGVPPGRAVEDLTRLNFVALLAVIGELARDDLAGHDPSLYEHLPRNTSETRVDVVVAGGRVSQPGAGPPFLADLAFDSGDDDRAIAGCGGERAPSRIKELGDARFLHAARRVDATGLLLVPGWAVAIDGLGATRWLDRDALTALARLGVAELIWRTRAEDRSAVAARARALGGAAVPRITVGEHAGVPILKRAPRGAGSGSLRDLLAAILGRPVEPGEVGELVRRLSTHPLRPGPRLVLNEPASFLLIRPRAEDRLDADATVEAVWLDGQEVGRRAP
jgi:hypothetical protein